MSTPTTPDVTPDFDFLEPEPELTAPPLPPRKKISKKWGWVLLLFLLVVAFIFWRRHSAAGADHVRVKTAKAALGTVTATVSASGTLQAFTTVDVKSKASGTVLQMAVEEGTVVKKGQLIAVIDRQDTEAAYRQAQADVTNAQAALQGAQDSANQLQQNLAPQIAQSQEGVNSASAKLTQARQNLQLEAQTNPLAIAQAVEALSASRAKLDQSRQALTIERATSQADLKQAQAGVVSAQAKLDQANQTYQAQPVLTGALINGAQAGVAASQATLNASQKSLDQLQNATQPQDRASVQAQVNQANSDLKTAQSNLARQQTLYKQGFVAQSVVETAQNQVDTAAAALKTAQAKLDTLQVQQTAALQQAQAEVDAARSNLGQSQANLKNAQANDVQIDLRKGDVAAAKAALGQAQATLNTARANLRQVEVKQGDVTSAIASMNQAAASLKTAQANSVQVGIKKGDVDSAIAAMRQSESALQGTQTTRLTVAAKQQDVISARATLDRDQVTAENALQNLQQTRVVAPRDGMVLQKYVDVGAIIQSGQSGFSGGTAIVQLAQVDRMYVDVMVDEADIAQVKPGQKVDVVLDAYPDTHKIGTVRKIYPLAVLDQNVTYIHVQVELNPKDVNKNLRPLMNATCDFLVQQKNNVITVPADAVKDEAGYSTVTVIKDPTQPHWETDNQDVRKVKVGVRGNDNVEILSGLKAGDLVVTQVIQPVPDSGAAGTTGTRSLTGARGGGGRRH